MNLHEECLIKYLLNPLDLLHTTNLLKFNNKLIEEGVKQMHKVNKKLESHALNTLAITQSR